MFCGTSCYDQRMIKGKFKYVIKRTGHGLGFIAEEKIPKGKRIIEYTGPVISNDKVNERNRGKYFFGLNSKWSIDGSPRSNIARYVNHSCHPNAEAIQSGKRIWIWSMKTIQAGEEVTYDYGEEYFDEHIRPKGCGCRKCKR